jgi:hypothetical protein
MERGEHDQALSHLLKALSIFIDRESPNASEAVRRMKELRSRWGEKGFDAAWKQRTGEEVPEELV